MATATSRQNHRHARRPVWVAAAAALVIVVAVAATAVVQPGSPARMKSAFSWLRPVAPTGWNAGTTGSGAKLAYPPGWRTIATDPGTVSAAPADPRGAFAGYLNATPRSGNETLANWSRFRPAHNADEGSRHVRLVATGRNLVFRGGRGSCVVDDYSTTATRFREIACIVAGSHATNVVVAAAPVARWAAQASLLERAVASFTA